MPGFWTPRRRSIYRYLEANPGISFPELCRGTGIPKGSMSVILNYMHTTYREVKFEGPKGKRRYFAVPGHFTDDKDKMPYRFPVGNPGRAPGRTYRADEPVEDPCSWPPVGVLPEGRCASVWDFARKVADA
jgi:hypothetical protein